MLKIFKFPFRLIAWIFNWFFYPQSERLIKRLAKGVMKLVGAFLFILNYSSVKSVYIDSMGIPGELLYYLSAIVIFAIALDGYHNVKTCHLGGYHPGFDWREFNSESCGPIDSDTQFNRIGEVLAYRETKMAGMGREDAAKLYAQTQGPLSTLSTGPNSVRAMRQIDTRLSGMDREQGLDYIKSLGKD